MNLLAARFLPLLGRASAEAAVVAVAVLLAQWLFGKKLGPRWRCALWLLLMARLAAPVFPASPASIFNFAAWSARTNHFGGRSSLTSAAPQALARVSLEGQPLAAVGSAAKFIPLNLPPAPVRGWRWLRTFSWLDAALGVWAAGAAILLWRLAGSVRASAARFTGQPVRDAELLELLSECCQLLGVRRPPALVECGGLGSPAMHGVFRPRLLLPRGFAGKFSPREVRFVFLHELAHLKRWDLPLHWAAAALQIIHWFNPLVWLAFARWRADREMACDAVALEALGAGQNHDYGRAVLRLLESLSHNPPMLGFVGILDDDGILERRIQMIARFRPGPRWPLPAMLVLAAMAAICLTDPAPLRSKPVELPAPIPARWVDPTAPLELDIDRYHDYRIVPTDPYFGALAGHRVYDGVPFEVNGRVSLYGRQEAGFARWRHFHDIAGIVVGRKFDELHLLHETRWIDVDGETIARYRLHYADGSTAELPIVYGAQVRDASRLPTEEKEALSDPSSKIVWRNYRPSPRPSIRVFASTLRNPFPEKAVLSMDVVSARQLASYDLLAATVCSRDPRRHSTPPLAWNGSSPRFDGEVRVRVTDKLTGAPLAGALVNPWISIDGQGWIATPFYTGANGEGAVRFPSESASGMGLQITKGGYMEAVKTVPGQAAQFPAACDVELTPVLAADP